MSNIVYFFQFCKNTTFFLSINIFKFCSRFFWEQKKKHVFSFLRFLLKMRTIRQKERTISSVFSTYRSGKKKKNYEKKLPNDHHINKDHIEGPRRHRHQHGVEAVEDAAMSGQDVAGIFHAA